MTSIAQIAKDARRRSRAKAPPERELSHHIAVAAGCETAVAFGFPAALDRLNLWGAQRVRVTPVMIGRAAA